ncbi:DMT family transporter [Peribacillus frigoritolerans]|nr:DMT family transporter [Peribacillus frigoritolerans]
MSFTVMAGSGGLHSINLGDVDILLSILSQALSFILINKASKTMDPRLLTGYMMLIGSFIPFLPSAYGRNQRAYLPWQPHRHPSGGAFFFSAIIATALGHMSYNYAIGKVGAAESSIFLNLNTLFSLLGAAVFLNEALVPAHFIGLIFIVSGVLLGSGAIEIWILQRKK